MGAAFALLLAFPDVARAQAFGPPTACGGGCYYADNNQHTFFYNSVTLQNIDAMERARVYSLNPTDMDTTVQSSSNGDTDVIVEDGYYYTGPAVGYAGLWRCYSKVSGSSTKCNQGHLLINDDVKGTTGDWPLSCQETGHSLGLDHSASTGSCMYQNSTYASQYYDAHDKGHINGYY